MNDPQTQAVLIRAVLSAAIIVLLGWQLGKTLLSGEVTISLNGRGAKRSEHPRVYWSWTLAMAALWVIVLTTFIRVLLER